MKKYTVDRLVDIIIALSVERDIDKLLKQILTFAMEITACDGGTIYTLEDEKLHFKHMINYSMGVSNSASDGTITLPPVPLGRKHVCACAALDGELINLPDIYESTKYDFDGAKQYDKLNNYRTGSMLVIPMVDQKDRVIGVLQLINALDPEGRVVAFEEEAENLIYGLASLVAVYLNNQKLTAAFYALLHSFVQVMVGAIDLRTPYNANHTKTMVSMGEKFIGWLNEREGDWHFAEEDVDPFLMSIWLHDIGKLITPLEVMEKATRLGDRYDTVMNRLTVASLMEEIHSLRNPGEAEACEEKRAQILRAKEFITEINKPSFLTDELYEQLMEISTIVCRDENDKEIPLLTEDEVHSLSIRRGTLTDEERRIIESHVSYTADMLSKVKFEGEYASVPFWAASHHELLNGSGYPNGKKGDELPREVRLITILDIYDALTAGDRPYKAPLPSEKAFSILGSMVEEGKIDGRILNMFRESGAWKTL